MATKSSTSSSSSFQQRHYSSSVTTRHRSFEDIRPEAVSDPKNGDRNEKLPLEPPTLSEWDKKLDRMLDELQRSVSSNQLALTEQDRHHREERFTKTSCASSGVSRRLFTQDGSSATNKEKVDDSAGVTPSSLRASAVSKRSLSASTSGESNRSQHHQHLYERTNSQDRSGNGGTGPLSSALSRSQSGAGSSSSQYRECRHYHESSSGERQNTKSGSNHLVGEFPVISDDEHHHTFGLTRSTSERGRTLERKGQQVIQGIKKMDDTDEIDSALKDLMVVSQMATSTTSHTPTSFTKSKTVRVVEKGSTGGAASASFSSRQQFYNYNSQEQHVSSSGGSSSRIVTQVHPAIRQTEEGSSRGAIKSSTNASNKLSNSCAITSNSSSTTKVDHSRINKSATDSSTHHHLNSSPVCNFPDHPEYPKHNQRIIPENAGQLCNVAGHPSPMCNIERHPNFPLYAACPPCPPASQEVTPVCNIKAHPALLCNYPKHPDYAKYSSGCPERETICNVPSHPELRCNLPKHPDYPKHASRCPPPEVEPVCNMELPSHSRPLCNYVRHPHYPKYCAHTPRLMTPGMQNTVCNIPAHPTDTCNVPEHPGYPDYKDNNMPNGADDIPKCSIPGHPMLLCNYPRHPDFPNFTHPELTDVAELMCTIPSHPQGRCNIPGHPEYPNFMCGNEPQTEPFCNVADHPFGLCNIQSHPNYPELMGADDKEAAPYCFIPSHPELICNMSEHPDFPGYMTEGPDAPLEPTCNVPRHPAIPPPPGVVICNIPYHPEYPGLMGTSSPLSLPICTVPDHPPLICNVPKHPDFPNNVGGIGLNSPPQCNIPGHPQLLCNLRHHPDYPRLSKGCPNEPYCNVPTHPLTNKPKMYQHGGGSPLPTRRHGSPDPGLQTPPKKLDDLMASFGGPRMTSTPIAFPVKEPKTNGVVGETETPQRPPTATVVKPATGPPVYYPPDHEPFIKSESSNSMMGRGKGKGKYKAKYSAKMGEKEKESKKGAAYGGAAVIPICLPVCCAMPCSIM